MSLLCQGGNLNTVKGNVLKGDFEEAQNVLINKGAEKAVGGLFSCLGKKSASNPTRVRSN